MYYICFDSFDLKWLRCCQTQCKWSIVNNNKRKAKKTHFDEEEAKFMEENQCCVCFAEYEEDDEWVQYTCKCWLHEYSLLMLLKIQMGYQVCVLIVCLDLRLKTSWTNDIFTLTAFKIIVQHYIIIMAS